MFLAVHQSNTPLVLQHTVSAPQRVEPERVEDASLREHQHRHLVGVGSGRAQRGHGAGERRQLGLRKTGKGCELREGEGEGEEREREGAREDSSSPARRLARPPAAKTATAVRSFLLSGRHRRQLPARRPRLFTSSRRCGETLFTASANRPRTAPLCASRLQTCTVPGGKKLPVTTTASRAGLRRRAPSPEEETAQSIAELESSAAAAW